MKLSTLMAGAAALAMVTSTAHADVISQHSANVLGATITNPLAVGIAEAFGASAAHAVGASAGNVGSASNTGTATFTLQGSVSKDCVFYSGALNNSTLDFGTLGIYASANSGPAQVFDMVAPAVVNISTNVAGCNTRNTVAVGKGHAQGMTTTNGSSFDPNQFTNVLPYTVDASWTGVADGSQTSGLKHLTLSQSQGYDNVTQGAWKSPFNVLVTIPVPTKSPVAGTYKDTLTVTLTAL